VPGKQRTTKHGPAQPDTRAQSKAAGNAAGGGDAETKDKSRECQQTRWVQHGAWRGGETYWLFTKSMALLVNMEAGAPLSFNCETEMVFICGCCPPAYVRVRAGRQGHMHRRLLAPYPRRCVRTCSPVDACTKAHAHAAYRSAGDSCCWRSGHRPAQWREAARSDRAGGLRQRGTHACMANASGHAAPPPA
jgi:hypothetical protein